MTAGELPPQPQPDPDSIGFWEATAEGRLSMCRCQDCRFWLHPPLERCRHCAGPTAFEAVSGNATLHSFIIVRHPAVVGFTDQLPYPVGLAELAEQPGLRLSARIVDAGDLSSLRIGAALRIDLVDHTGGKYVVPVIRLAQIP